MYIEELYEEFQLDGGFTRNSWDKVPTEGYVVGWGHSGYHYPGKLKSLVTLRIFQMGFDKVTEALDTHFDKLYAAGTWNESMRQSFGYGAWWDRETGFYFDAVDIYNDLIVATEAAKSRGELALYDLNTNTEIRIDNVTAA